MRQGRSGAAILAVDQLDRCCFARKLWQISPTEQTLAGQSWHAQAAYATHLARGVQPLFVTADQPSRNVLDLVLTTAEAIVQGTGTGDAATFPRPLNHFVNEVLANLFLLLQEPP